MGVRSDSWALSPARPATYHVGGIQGIGECEITFDGVDLGLTKGGTEVQILDGIHRTKIDKYGDSPVRAANRGTNVMFRTYLIEHDYDMLAEAMQSSGTRGTVPDRVTFGGAGGDEITGKELRCHPRNVQGGDWDVIVYAAVPELDSAIPYKIDGEKIYPVQWFGMIDESRTDGDLLFRIGNDS